MAATDETLMPYGKYKGIKLANVPASYLIWMYENNKLNNWLLAYVKDNLTVLEMEVLNGNKKKFQD